MSEKFRSLTSTESSYFSSILDVMYHTKKEEGRRFLCMINNIVDYNLNTQTENNNINYQIIHISNSPIWIRELLIRFIIYKTALSFNKTTIDRFKNSIQKTIVCNDKKTVKLIQDRNKYFRKLTKIFRGFDIAQENHKSFIIAKEQDLRVKKNDKNPWIYDFFSESIDDEKHNLILSTTITAFDLEKTIKKVDPEYIPLIDHIFIFHSPNKSKVSNSYNKNQLERLNRFGVGIKNCIVFSFSDQPFRLYYTIDNVKYRLASALLNKAVSRYDDFEGFITFTQEETEFLFNSKKKQETFLVDCPDRAAFTSDIDLYIESIPYNLKFKNNLALSFTDNLQNHVAQSIGQEIKGFSRNLCGDFFNLLKQLWENDIKTQIEAFIGDCSFVGFVLPYHTSQSIKKSILKLFQKPNLKIQFYSLESFKRNVKAEKIIVLQYRYTNKYHKTYPNSFDPLPLKSNQKALIIINRLTHNDYFEWNDYWYRKDLNGLLFSKFRQDVLGWKKRSFQRPVLPEVLDYINEAENDARTYQIEKCRIFYSDENRPKEYLASERILYKENGVLSIAELKDIATLEDISIQMLDEIIEQVKMFITSRSEDKTKSEIYLRRDPKFNLSEEEINSSTELWKFLLKRRVNTFGEKVVYDKIFASVPENDRISLNTFNQWHNLDSNLVLPRSRKHQIALLTYLGFELKSPYFLIMIAKKLSNINNSRFLNSQIETLLSKSLISKINDKRFESLSESHSDIFTLLDIKNIEDLNALIDLLEIKLTPIKRIEYDQD